LNWYGWLLWGFAATLVMTTMLSASQGLGLTRMNIPYLLGSMLTPDRDRARLLGFFVHLANGWLFALLYIAIFYSLGSATWWLGVIIGFMHAAFVLTVGLPSLPGLHPRMASERHGPTATRLLEPPGFMGLNYGTRTPVSAFIAHMVFGAMLGGLYHL
jgi:hypothetical protein